MSKSINIIGHRYGRWTVLKKSKTSYYTCKCDCGTIKDVFIGSLRPVVRSQSCGCWGWSKAIRAASATTHGLSKTRAYKAWLNMKKRVRTRTEYAHVRIDPRWNSFLQFFDDLGECPAGYSLERINNNGNYCKENCTWIPRGDQAKNTRRQVWFTYDDKTHIFSDWCRLQGLPVSRVRARVKRGWSMPQALELEPRRRP